MARKSSISSSSSNNRWRYILSSYYLKHPKRLAFLFISFVFLTFFIWDRQSLIREHEAEITKLSQDLLRLQNQLQEFKSASGETMITNVLKDDPDIRLTFNGEGKSKKLCFMHGLVMKTMLGDRMNFRYKVYGKALERVQDDGQVG
ncbi:hypothetical protein IFM89_033703 [Coptis chinensis]|uniref:Uncharacterized protein n=1 Tax=Coptis chinensis TaxID=261450 RepID=A0A835LTM7_9MAGN|nr:hypothetical protein IFM89_033703 [Coptis chinensis]